VDIVTKLKNEFGNDLPGFDAQIQMAAGNRVFYKLIKNTVEPKKAAIFILLFFDNNKLHTIFIKRTKDSGPHSEQIAFPGGMYELKDENLYTTSIREASEEIGISSSNIEFVGELTSLHIPVSNIIVSPFVFYVDSMPTIAINKDEVQEAIIAPVDEFLNNKILSSFKIKFKGNEYDAPCFKFNNNIIWGATAMIWNEFLTIYKRILK